MQISVVIPAFNAARTLAGTVSSIRNQEPVPSEIVVVDDGSADHTADVAQTLGVRLVRQENGGPSRARNTGIAVTTGDWVAFADADDVWLPGKLELQIACLARYPDAVLIAGDWVRHAPAVIEAVQPQVRVFGYRDLLQLNRFQTSTVLVRADVVKRLGGFDERLDGVEDWDMWLRCSKEGPIAKLDAPIVVYRDEPVGYSKDLRRVYQTMLAMLDREEGSNGLPAHARRTLRAWHHLRFAVGFLLEGDRAAAAGALRDLRRAGVTRAAPEACVRYLLPFLAGRLRRRLPQHSRASA